MSSLREPSPENVLGRARRRELPGGAGPIALLDWGGAGPLALLHHANGFCKGVWGLVADALVPHYRVVAMDARGHGDSARAPAPEGYAWRHFADDIVRVAHALLGETGGSKLALGLGHSFGGTSMLGAASRAPDLFERLILVDPVIPVRASEGPQARAHVEQLVERARKRRSDWPSGAEAREWLAERELFAGWDPRALDLYVRDGLRVRPGGGVELKCAGDVEAEVFARGGEVDVSAWAAAVEVPTLFLWAARGNFPRERYEQLVAPMPRARIEDLDAGHLVPMERPDLVVEAALRLRGEAL